MDYSVDEKLLKFIRYIRRYIRVDQQLYLMLMLFLKSTDLSQVLHQSLVVMEHGVHITQSELRR